MERSPNVARAVGNIDRVLERIKADLDAIEAGLDRARDSVEAHAAGEARRIRAGARVNAALGLLNEMLGESDEDT